MTLTEQQLMALLPHRPPILILQEVVDLIPRESGTGMRHFKLNDPFFAGHFPDKPILPGALVIEAFAQTAMAVFLVERANGELAGGPGLLAKVNEMMFAHVIVPGQNVGFAITVDRLVGPFAFVSCEATGGGVKFASGKLTLKIGN